MYISTRLEGICPSSNIFSVFINLPPFAQVVFQVADALNQPFPDGHFDLVWAMESGEHMPDKEKVR